jgi:hydrogenase-4 membrane subunit HyfE
VNLSQVDVIAAGVAVTAVWMCGVTRIHNLLWIVAVQTGLLAAIAGVHGLHANTPQYLFLAGVVLAIKAFAIPAYLAWAADQVGIRRDAGSVLSPTLALPAGAGTLAMGYFLTGQVAPASAQHPGAAGMALTLLLIGMLLMLTDATAGDQPDYRVPGPGERHLPLRPHADSWRATGGGAGRGARRTGGGDGGGAGHLPVEPQL